MERASRVTVAMLSGSKFTEVSCSFWNDVVKEFENYDILSQHDLE